MQGPPGAIAYRGAHEGPRRTLTLHLRGGFLKGNAAHVTIDGATHVLPWGTVLFEVPADRSVDIGVHQIVRQTVGLARATLEPGVPAELEYRGPAHRSRPGELGPPGTVRSRGTGLQVALLGTAALLVLVLLVFILAIALS